MFQRSTTQLIKTHGIPTTYFKQTGSSEYDLDTGKMVDSFDEIKLKAYFKESRNRNLNSPNLIGKEVVLVLIDARSLGVKPEIGDRINDVVSTLKVAEINYAMGGGEVVLWRLSCVR